MQIANLKTRTSLAERVADEFRRATALIESIDDAVYRFSDDKSGSVGAQFRHNLEIAENFLRGVEDGAVDYGNRPRDLRVETDRGFASLRFEIIVERISSTALASPENGVLLVRSEVDLSVWHRSSRSRELEFLLSHTIHHHAIIAQKLRGLGVDVDSDFGVAPSTLDFHALAGRNI